jgi:hypothetical protein
MGLVSNRTIVVGLYQALVTDRPRDELRKTISLRENLPVFREKAKLCREATIRLMLPKPGHTDSGSGDAAVEPATGGSALRSIVQCARYC